MVTIKVIFRVTVPDVGIYFHSEEPKGSGQSNIPRAGELGFSYCSGPHGSFATKWQITFEVRREYRVNHGKSVSAQSALI